MWFSLLQVWTFQGVHTVEAAVTSHGSGPLLWLVKRNQVRLPERFGPLQPATAGLAKPSPWRKRREEKLAATAFLTKSHSGFDVVVSYSQEGRRKEETQAKRGHGSHAQHSTLHPQLQPCTHLSHTLNDDANDGAWANLAPARGRT